MSVEAVEVGILVGKDIPVRNLWLLYLWASDLYEFLEPHERTLPEQDAENLPALAATILCSEVEHRLRREPTVQYVARREHVAAVRGRIDHLETARKSLLDRGRVSCSFEELSVDSPRHRYVLAALTLAGRALPEHADLQQRCLSTAAWLQRLGVTSGQPDPTTPRREVFGHFDSKDRRMVAAARLVVDALLPSHVSGTVEAPVANRDEHVLRRLYEKAIRNFLAVQLPWKVHAPVFHWPVQTPAAAWFPTMRTDITIDRPSGIRLVIDTKFTQATRVHHRSRHTSLREAHLYQLYAYLRSQVDVHRPQDGPVAGLLLYPQTGVTGPVDVVTNIQGHPVRAATVNLMTEPPRIRERLLELARWPAEARDLL